MPKTTAPAAVDPAPVVLVYIGPYDRVDIPPHHVEIERDVPFSVVPEVAEQLLAQPDNFRRADVQPAPDVPQEG